MRPPKMDVDVATIDDRISALNFTAATSRAPDTVIALLDDAAAVARGGKIVLTLLGDGRVQGRIRNFARVTHAEFIVQVEPAPDGRTTVWFEVGDYLRARQTVLAFIPISPWSAPAYKPLRDFVEYLRSKL